MKPPFLKPRRRDTEEPSSLGQMAASGASVKDPIGEFAEIYGSSMVNARRMFFVAAISSMVSIVAVIGMWQVSSNHTAIPVMVRVNDNGIVDRPVRIESITTPQAVVKAELAKWVQSVFTIDPKTSPDQMRVAVTRARDKAVEQYREWRVKEDVLGKLTSSNGYIRLAKVGTVDLTQPGVAFVFVTTTEAVGANSLGGARTFRVRLNYELTPPTTEREIFDNPLGLSITFFNPSEETR